MELVLFLLIVGVIGIIALLYFMTARDHERVTLKGQWGGGGGSGDDGAGRDGSVMASTKLSEGIHVNLTAQSPRARVSAPAPAAPRKLTPKPAVKRTATSKVPVTGKKKDSAAIVRRRTRS